ncbi:hypothetical protein Aglo03_62620 [Actinokineospora globicatena]|uniref:Uncharacterized protein n=1 Tax=Actinokineospora globicatena TaxID=103729 RepID=A0A9W6QR95_9PSEU|nr:hypothetical protein Aglo03_62620 [Actinokineospora globicatena]
MRSVPATLDRLCALLGTTWDLTPPPRTPAVMKQGPQATVETWMIIARARRNGSCYSLRPASRHSLRRHRCSQAGWTGTA